jgi:hypothetical protein
MGVGKANGRENGMCVLTGLWAGNKLLVTSLVTVSSGLGVGGAPATRMHLVDCLFFLA